RVNGYSPGRPSRSSYRQPGRSAGPYTRSTGTPDMVSKLGFRSVGFSSRRASVMASASRSRSGRSVSYLAARRLIRWPSALGRSPVLQERPADDQPLDLGRSLVDLRDLGVPEEPLDRILLHVPVAAVNLDRVRRHAHGGLGGEELGHRRRQAVRLVAVLL